MTVTLIILCCLLFAASIILLPTRQLLAPAAAYFGMLAISFARTQDGYPVVPLNTTILTGWMCMTVVVMLATLLQPLPVRNSSKGMGYISIGALAGMAVGLLGFSVSSQINLLYGIMIAATALGVFFGFLLYTNTPAGRPVGISSGNFFKYLLAKGFPTAITVMQIGVVLVIVLFMHKF